MMARAPSDFAYPHLRVHEVVPVQRSADQCIRAAVGSALALEGRMEVDR